MAGWDQLLPPSQRQQASEARGCSVSTRISTAPLADQMAIYALPINRGPLGPLASPSNLVTAAARRTRDLAPRTAPVDFRITRAAGRPMTLAPLVDRAAREHDIDPLLLHAIARVESRHQPGAISHAGAHGLMQVIVPTARRFGVGEARALHDPETNLQVSARYLKTLQRRFGNDLSLVLAAYNAGEGAVEKHGRRIPPYRETQDYVRKVLGEYSVLRRVSRQHHAAPSRAEMEASL